MSAYARIYGFQLYTFNQVKGHSTDYIKLAWNCFMRNSDYAMLEEILENEN